LRLGDLVAEGRFDPTSPRHRQLLQDGELPAGVDAGLVQVQMAYRRAPNLAAKLFLARNFKRLLEH
jgi:hypothetical protein